MKLTEATVAGIDLPPGQSERIVFDERLPDWAACAGRRNADLGRAVPGRQNSVAKPSVRLS